MALESVSGYYEGFTLLQLEEAILWELGQVIGTDATYNKFPQTKIREKLNDRQQWFVWHTHCLKKTALIKAKADYRQYKLPANCIDGGLIAAKYYDSSTSYQELEIVDSEYMNTVFEGYLVTDSGTPEFCFMGDSYGNIPMLEVHPPPSSDGTDYAVSPDTGVTIGGDIPGATSNISGTATGGNGTTLTDTATTFTSLGLVGGMYVRNVTDGSYGYILSVATNSITLAATLTGGTANTFSAGDSYLILAGEYGVLSAWDDDDTYLFGSEVGLLSSITVPAGNFRIDFVPYPLEFPSSGNDQMKPEIPKLYQMKALAMGVVADFLGTFHEDTKQFKRAQSYENKFLEAVAQGMKKKKTRPFKDKPTRIRPLFNG